MGKVAVKEKEPYFNIIFNKLSEKLQKLQIGNSSGIMYKTNFFKESCPKNVDLMKTK